MEKNQQFRNCCGLLRRPRRPSSPRGAACGVGCLTSLAMVTQNDPSKGPQTGVESGRRGGGGGGGGRGDRRENFGIFGLL